ncbi:MAG TPA: glycosyltransferase family 4 protein [Deltaproteobacteria bacterium]|nr:glycosyltransferase family 4 protein [Deltaproteobacteria bacterium]
MGLEGLRIAIVHDYLNQRGGAERVVAALHELFPRAPIYTSIVDYDNLLPELAGADIRPSWMQRLPGVLRHFKKYVMLYPRVFDSLMLDGYDIIVSSSSAFGKGATKADPSTFHVCYCHTPMRFVWDYESYVEREGMGPLTRAVLPRFIEGLRRWDLATKDRPDRYVANSSKTRERIARFYGRHSTVIFPPVETSKFTPSAGAGDYYLIVSRLNSYKSIDLAVEAFNTLGLPLKVVGDGPYAPALRAMAARNVEFPGPCGDDELARWYAGCRALVFPGEEDFGIAPLEANAAGRPVIAFRGGGALDTVKEGVSGIFFDERTPESIADAVRRFEEGAMDVDPAAIRAHALRFDSRVFKERFLGFIEEKFEEFAGGGRTRAAAGTGGRRG